MSRRLIVSATVLAASLFGTQAIYAAPAHTDAPVHAMVTANAKLVKFSVRNDSGAPMRLKAGDSELAIAAGKTAQVKLPEGTQLIALEATNREPGSLVATVSNSLNGNTLALR